MSTQPSQAVARLSRLEVAATTLWRYTQRHGERLLETEQARQLRLKWTQSLRSERLRRASPKA